MGGNEDTQERMSEINIITQPNDICVLFSR